MHPLINIKFHLWTNVENVVIFTGPKLPLKAVWIRNTVDVYLYEWNANGDKKQKTCSEYGRLNWIKSRWEQATQIISSRVKNFTKVPVCTIFVTIAICVQVYFLHIMWCLTNAHTHIWRAYYVNSLNWIGCEWMNAFQFFCLYCTHFSSFFHVFMYIYCIYSIWCFWLKTSTTKNSLWF